MDSQDSKDKRKMGSEGILKCEQLCFFFFGCFFSMKVYAKEQGIQDSIANGQYPNYKDTNRQSEKEANIKVKLMKVWI